MRRLAPTLMLLGLATLATLAALAAIVVAPPGASAGERSRAGVERKVIGGQVTGGFQLTPTRLSDTVGQGETVTRELTIVNQTGAPQVFRIEAADLAPGRGQGHSVIATAGSTETGAGSWIEPATSRVHLDNLEQATIDVRVTAPGKARPGGHYGAVVVAMDARDAGGQVDVVTQIVSQVVAMVPGHISYGLELDDVHVPGRVAWRSVELVGTAVNTGDIHTVPRLEATFASELGEHEVEGDVPEILPGGEREIRVTWDDPPAIGRVTPTLAVTLEDGETITASAEPTWVVTPLAVIVASAIAVVLVAGTWWWLWSRRRIDAALLEELGDDAGADDDDGRE